MINPWFDGSELEYLGDFTGEEVDLYCEVVSFYRLGRLLIFTEKETGLIIAVDVIDEIN